MNEPMLSKAQLDGEAQIPAGSTLFGVYEVLGVLGGGGMGWVYRARHKQLSSLRAIKVIRPDLLLNSNMEQLFVREAHALMEIHHDAVVRCHDLLSENGRIYLVMEFVQGPSLEEMLRDGPITPEEVRALMRRVASGLAAAHALGVVHRDISPGNIILPDGRAEEAKLIDFGVAAVAAVPGQTIAGDFKGKLAYASPEQFGLFDGKVDARSDIYSLGLVLAEAASGAQVPMGQTFYEAIELRKARPRIPPSVPADLQAELLPLLEPDPAHRPQTAAEVAEARHVQQPTQKLAPNNATVEKARPEASPGTTASPVHWLIPLVYSATAVGVGIGLGLMTWIYWTSAGPAPPKNPAPVSKPSTANPVPAPTPSPPPTQQAATPPPSPANNAAPASVAPSSGGGTVSRAQVIGTADQLSKYVWQCSESNRRAPCAHGVAYRSDWQPNQQVQGLPYNWGGADGPDQFSLKLRRGMGAGSHKWNGVLGCTAGIDCSGFVAYCWGHRTGGHGYSTANMGSFCTRMKGDVYSTLKPGDALNKPGSHIVLFAGYRPDGGPIVYEANGSAARVIRNEKLSWSSLAGYYPVRSNDLVDP